jgi:hypothetical protein
MRLTFRCRRARWPPWWFNDEAGCHPEPTARWIDGQEVELEGEKKRQKRLSKLETRLADARAVRAQIDALVRAIEERLGELRGTPKAAAAAAKPTAAKAAGAATRARTTRAAPGTATTRRRSPRNVTAATRRPRRTPPPAPGS